MKLGDSVSAFIRLKVGCAQTLPCMPLPAAQGSADATSKLHRACAQNLGSR